eukprot:PITA_33761
MSLRPNSWTEIRKKNYKPSVNANEACRKREDNLIEIRKSKTEDNLQKQRREGMLAVQHFLQQGHSTIVDKKLESLPAMVAGVWFDDPTMQLEASTQFRKLLSIGNSPEYMYLYYHFFMFRKWPSEKIYVIECSPPIEEVIAAGVVPRLVEFLARDDFPQFQFEETWALTNIASGTSKYTRVVIDHGAVPKFVQLLSVASDDVREQVAF